MVAALIKMSLVKNVFVLESKTKIRFKSQQRTSKSERYRFQFKLQNNIFILILYDNAIFFVFLTSINPKPLFLSCVQDKKKITIFYLIVFDVVKLMLPTIKIHIFWVCQKIHFIYFFSIPGKDNTNSIRGITQFIQNTTFGL